MPSGRGSPRLRRMSYDVVLLVEQALSSQDATQVRSLHEGLDEPVAYHVILPMEDAAARIEASLGTLNGGEILGTPSMLVNEVDLDAVRKDCLDRATDELSNTLDASARRARPRRVRSWTLLRSSAQGQGHRGRRARGHHPDPPARGRGVLPRRLDVAGATQDRGAGAAPARARELRRTGRRGRGRHRRLSLPHLAWSGDRFRSVTRCWSARGRALTRHCLALLRSDVSGGTSRQGQSADRSRWGLEDSPAEVTGSVLLQ